MGYVRFAILELRNQVTIPSYTNDVILRVTNLKFEKKKVSLWVISSKIKLLLFYFRVSNSKSKKIHFELLTWKLSFSCFTFHLLTRNGKKLQVTNSMIKLLFFQFQVTNSRLENKKFHLELLTR